MRVIVDANIAFRAISGHGGDIRLALRPPAPAELCTPRFIFAELFKHKERLQRHTGWDNDTLTREITPRKLPPPPRLTVALQSHIFLP